MRICAAFCTATSSRRTSSSTRGPSPRHRLRPGQAGRGRRRADRQRRDPGHARLHEPRAGERAPRLDHDGDRRLWPGAILYALLTGKAPFGGDSVIDTLDAVRKRPPEPPTKFNERPPRPGDDLPEVPGEGPAAAIRFGPCPGRRPAYWLDSRPITARRVGPAERAWLWCKRKPAVAALAAARRAGRRRRHGGGDHRADQGEPSSREKEPRLASIEYQARRATCPRSCSAKPRQSTP